MRERDKMHQSQLFPSRNLVDIGSAPPSPSSWSAEFFSFGRETKMSSLGDET